MKYRSVETRKLNENYPLREIIAQRMEEIRPLAFKRFKSLVSVLTVATALFGGEVKVDSEEVKKVLSKERIEEVASDLFEKGQEAANWIQEKGSEAIVTATPVVENVVADLYESFSPTNISGNIQNTDVTNNTVKLDTEKFERDSLLKEVTPKEESSEVNNENFFPNPTPATIGKEVEELPFRTVTKEEDISLSRPFDYQETNDILQNLEITAKDILSPDYSNFQNFDALINPEVSTLAIFPEKVMLWKDIIEEECKRFNSLPENKGFEVSPSIAMAILTIETFGNENAVNSISGATGGYQFMPFQFYDDYILSGAFDGGERRILSFEEFNSKLKEKRYSTKLFLRYWSDMKRYNQEIYQKLEIDTPMEELVFQLAEYNGGQQNAINVNRGVSQNYENTRYVRMGVRIALVAEIANDLRDLGYQEDYNKMISSRLIDLRVEEALFKKSQSGAGSFESTRKILQLSGQREFLAGNVTRKLFLDEIPTVTPTYVPGESNIPYKYSSNPAIDIIYNFEYNS